MGFIKAKAPVSTKKFYIICTLSNSLYLFDLISFSLIHSVLGTATSLLMWVHIWLAPCLKAIACVVTFFGLQFLQIHAWLIPLPLKSFLRCYHLSETFFECPGWHFLIAFFYCILYIISFWHMFYVFIASILPSP